MNRKFYTIVVLLALFLILFSFFKINLPTADIGRHIINGDIFLHSGEYNISKSDILNTNLFSYTNPTFPFVNHHWGSGMLIYLIYSMFGFGILSIFYFLLILGALIFTLLTIREQANLKILFLTSIFLIPLIAGRHEVRPEGLSYFFLALFLYILYKYTNNKISAKMLWVLPALQLILVNTHIYFIFGIFLIGMFLVQELILYCLSKNKNNLEKIKKLFLVLGASLFMSILNPYGIKGLLYPFTIFQNYGYRIVENQSIHFLENISFTNPEFLWYKITLFLLIISSFFVIFKQKKNYLQYPWALAGISFTFAVLAYLGIRHIPIFALLSLSLLVYNFTFIKNIFQEKINRYLDKDWKNISFLLIFIMITTITMLQFSVKLPWNRNFGIGIDQKQLEPINFIKENKIHGPFFNNYDIGGMMIFGLYPDEKVFVDNRPEAYPKEFLQDTYILMQEDDKIWQEKLDKEKFNAIFFYRLDYTPWAQKFLLTRIKDPMWAPVFVDEQTIIFLARSKENTEIIKKYELPKSMFNINQ